jgi:hypothetical protein
LFIFSLVKNQKAIVMTPHKSKLAKMSDSEQRARTRLVDVEDHNSRFISRKRAEKEADNGALMRIRRRQSAIFDFII